jgi:hypothetical protein
VTSHGELADVEVEGEHGPAIGDGGGREEQGEAGEQAELEGADVGGRAGDQEGEVQDGERREGLGEADAGPRSRGRASTCRTR